MPTYLSNQQVLALADQVEPESFVALVDQRRKTLDVKYDQARVRKIGWLLNYWGKIFEIPSIFVAAQVLHETGFFSFTGDVKPNQFNFAGIGTTGGGVPGHSFFDEDAGVLAVYVHHTVYLRGAAEFWPEHLRQYANTAFNPRLPIVLEAVKRLGTISTIQNYSGRWAVGPRYHETILKIMSMMEVERETVSLPFKLRVSHIPWNNPNRTRQKSLESGRGWITIHETSNTSKGANAEMHRKFTHNGGGGENVSFNYVLDDNEVVELVPRGEKTWQAGDGANGPGNSSVSIEACVNSDGNWTKTKENLAQFVVFLIKNDNNLSRSRICQHNKWSGKNCPLKLRANNNREWNQLMARIDQLLNVAPAPAPVINDPNSLQVNGFWMINDIYHFWRSFDSKTLPMVGYPVSMMFEGPVGLGNNEHFRLVQLFERGALAVYVEGTPDGVPKDHPFRVRNLFPAERAKVLQWGKENGFVGRNVT